MMTVVNKNGFELDFDATVDFMDDDLREQLHSAMAPCTEQEFFTAYETAFELKTGQEWFLSSANPTW